MEIPRPSPKPPFDGEIAAALPRENCSHLTPMSAEAWEAELSRSPSFPAEKIARLVDAIRHGVEIGYTGDRTKGRTAFNSSTTVDSRVAKLISEGIATDVAAGYKRGPFDYPPFLSSMFRRSAACLRVKMARVFASFTISLILSMVIVSIRTFQGKNILCRISNRPSPAYGD